MEETEQKQPARKRTSTAKTGSKTETKPAEESTKSESKIDAGAEAPAKAEDKPEEKKPTRRRTTKTKVEDGGTKEEPASEKTDEAKSADRPSQGEERDGERENGGENRRGGNNRNRRNRYRDRRRGGEDIEPEISEDDELIQVAGILDVLDNYAFLRTSGYLPGQNDVYVSLGQVKKNGLRKGDAVVGVIKAPKEGEPQNSRQKFNALARVDSVNGIAVAEVTERIDFAKLTPLYPDSRLRLETGAKKISTRIIDLVSPIGKGQRGLIVSPPKAGKTLILQAIANSITENNPEVHLMVVLVDERPEEVTDMQRTVKGEVIASTFDRPADDHTTVAELAIGAPRDWLKWVTMWLSFLIRLPGWDAHTT